MLRFEKLQLTGFKSFVDQTELEIQPGLTGVVGPNGCGKSNLVEALRWVMGETSAKQMRGGEMDDVIFGGTSNRPARNIGEVCLNLDNTSRVAPAMFNEFDQLEISRKIERERGSTYRVNGKEVRAKDVQLLFADAATGARSTAMVSQGRIGAVINAKPAQRRALLEEAAGITGLHSRRHEAELRLRAAESNLERLEDIMAQLDAQMAGLKKQSRQANRYRNLSDHIRKAEATLFHLRWVAAHEELETHKESLKTAESQVAELTGLSAAATTRQAGAAEAMPERRQAEAAAAAELHRLVVAREGLDEEERRIDAAVDACEQRIQQVIADINREKSLTDDARAAVQRLDLEQAEINKASGNEEQVQGEAAEELSKAVDVASQLDQQLSQLTEKVAADEARRNSLIQNTRELDTRLGRQRGRAADVNLSIRAIEADLTADDAVTKAAAAVGAAFEAMETTRAEVETAELARTETGEAASEAVNHLHEARAALTGLETEDRTLAGLLDDGAAELWPPLIDKVTVEPGLEAALGAALGGDLSAPADEPAPVHWRTLPELSGAPALPEGARPLSRFVQGPAALSRRLSQIGVVDDEEEGGRLSSQLAQGQRLVGRDGSLWRWDGFTISAGAPTAAAARLEQKNRLTQVRAKLADARALKEETERASNAARATADAAAQAERDARTAAQAAADAHTRSRDAQNSLKEKTAEQSLRLTALKETAAELATEIGEGDGRAKEAADVLAQLPDTAAARDEVTRLRADVSDKRSQQLEAQATHDALLRASEERRRRLDGISRELESWKQRADAAKRQGEQLSERHESLKTEKESLSTKPTEIIEQRNSLQEKIDGSEARRKTAADALAEQETKLKEADNVLREAEHALARAREERVRIEGAVEQSNQATESLTVRIAERVECEPGDLFEISGLKEDADLPDMESSEKRVERLLRERDTMGPVNLRAEHEAEELSQQVEGLNTERGDLVEAIEKLRRGISELNREGRQRLLASFEEVDKHFQELFVRLFGGGEAHLKLIESDDPLEAGLEIMASPPGKKMQVLSLLSGGEQALTALALLFGVFLTNPAPICVLDEVDAPLDDANVDRFCTMLDEMARAGVTRFLVITHHRMTMARMNRLFGVTMAERGVSQLVSVDLQEAEVLRDTG